MTDLVDLVGKRILDYVPDTSIRHPIDPDANGVMFSLDEVTYLIFEDPSDGYRSNAGPILFFSGDPSMLGGSRRPERLKREVLCGMGGEGGEVLEMRDALTGQIVFRVGTDNSDDYYPFFVVDWRPGGLLDNQGRSL